MNNTITKLEFKLPFFPGFYESWLLSRSDLECDLENCSDQELQEIYDDEFLEWNKLEDKGQFGEYLADHVGFDFYSGKPFNEACKMVSKYCFDEFFEDFLNSYDKEQLGIKSFEFEELTSPKEYNFSTDRVFGVIELNLTQFKKTMTKLILDNKDKFQELLNNRHRSRDGFYSFYDHNLESWLSFQSRDLTSDGDDNPDSVMLETLFMFYSELEKGQKVIDELYMYANEAIY